MNEKSEAFRVRMAKVRESHGKASISSRALVHGGEIHMLKYRAKAREREKQSFSSAHGERKGKQIFRKV